MEKLTDSLKKITEGFQEAVKKAIQEHWDAGRPVYEWRDGKVVKVPPPQKT